MSACARVDGAVAVFRRPVSAPWMPAAARTVSSSSPAASPAILDTITAHLPGLGGSGEGGGSSHPPAGVGNGAATGSTTAAPAEEEEVSGGRNGHASTSLARGSLPPWWVGGRGSQTASAGPA